MTKLLSPGREKLVPVIRTAALPPEMPNPGEARNYSAALSPDQQTNSDVISQVYRGTSIVRHSPLPVQASAAVGAAANSAAKTIVEENTGNTTTYVPGTNITFTQQQQSVFAINASSGSSIPQWPLPNTALVYEARAIVAQTGLQTIGDLSTNIQNGGIVSVSNGAFPTATLGVAVPFTVGSGAGNGFNGWFPTNSTNNTNGIFRAGRNCKYQARVGVGTSAAGVIVFLGFSTATPSTMRTFPFVGATSYLGLYTPGAGIADTWHATINGSAVDTGIVIGTGAALVEIIMNDTANTTSFAVNGNSPTIISGSNPTGLNWFPTATFAVNVTATFSFAMQYFYAQQDF